MKYSNQQIPEGINTSTEHPLREFALLSSGVIGALFLAITLLVFLSDVVTAYIPFSVEKDITPPAFVDTEQQGPMRDYLQSMADRITSDLDMPEGMRINVYYVDNETVNAFATLGGNIIMFRGLLEKLPNENALLMLLAHEIAHVLHRHPMKSMGRGVVIGLVVALVSSAAGDAIIESVLGNTSHVTLLSYSREMEDEADDTAIKIVKNSYGHLHGANKLFEILQQETGHLQPPEFLSTHPVTESRLGKLTQQMAPYKSDHYEITPLPSGFKAWLDAPVKDNSQDKIQEQHKQQAQEPAQEPALKQ